jgi:hypothetical protein
MKHRAVTILDEWLVAYVGTHGIVTFFAQQL